MTMTDTIHGGPGWWKASDGQWYPPPKPMQASPTGPPPTKKRHTGRWIALVLVVALVAIVIFATTSSSGGKKVASSAAPAAKAAPASPAAAHKVGDTATTAGWQVTVYAAQDPWTPATGQFAAPAAPGTRFVQVDLQVRNTKSDSQAFSSLVETKLIDQANRAYSESLTTAQPAAPDGEIPAGQAVRGFVTFEVPTTATGLVFQVQGSLTAAGARFSLS